MARPLFQIARDISEDWQTPSPPAKTYLKGMFYLLGMDDRVADLDADTTVRMFLLYSKEWTGPTADRIKAELKEMRSTHQPTNASLLAANKFASSKITCTHCEMCDASLGAPAKLVDAHTHWQVRKRMCMHCALFMSPGLDLGDGALLMADDQGTWRHLHGKPEVSIAAARLAAINAQTAAVRAPQRMLIRHQLKILGRRVVRKCLKIAKRCLRRSA